jgi:hypothetical protein
VSAPHTQFFPIQHLDNLGRQNSFELFDICLFMSKITEYIRQDI